VGDVDAARRHLEVAEVSAARWAGSAWGAAVLEARAHLARALGDEPAFVSLVSEAAQLFAAAGQPRDAERCAAAVPRSAPLLTT
jgi:hypothetical protein